ncbi:uncharacterized protein LOC136025878 isoform X2 [Artemia franciscana]|uniref:uncharacterized protein LOC136025878 isoform X2 n=1 Tax=Artemia franciscana TaxID=6661 RepID=UPI0032DAECA5
MKMVENVLEDDSKRSRIIDDSDIPLIDADIDTVTTNDIQRTGSDSSPFKWSSDQQRNTLDLDKYQLTVKSYASIGLGVSDGRKIFVRKVDTTANDEENDNDDHFLGIFSFILRSFIPMQLSTDGSGTGNRTIYKDGTCWLSKEAMSNFQSQDGDIREHPPYTLCAWLLVIWFSIFLFQWRLFRKYGRSFVLSATLPIITIISFMTLSLTLDGAGAGVRRLFTIDWDILSSSEVWVDGVSQGLSSISLAYGVVILSGSFNKFTDDLTQSSMFLIAINGFMSIVSAITFFASLGSIISDYGHYVLSGPESVFEVYAYMADSLSLSQASTVIFGLLIVVCGLNTQTLLMEVVVMAFQSVVPNSAKKFLRYREFLSLPLCITSFVIGSVIVLTDGNNIIQFVDDFVTTKAVLFLLTLEIVAVSWIYGFKKLCKNIREMTRKWPSLMYQFAWAFTIPFLSIVTVVVTTRNYNGSFESGEDVEYIYAGWFLLFIIFAPVPITAAMVVVSSEGKSLKKKIIKSFKSEIEDCPCCNRGISCLHETQSTLHANHSSSAPQLQTAAEATKRYFSTTYNHYVTVAGTNLSIPLGEFVNGGATLPKTRQDPSAIVITNPKTFEALKTTTPADISGPLLPTGNITLNRRSTPSLKPSVSFAPLSQDDTMEENESPSSEKSGNKNVESNEKDMPQIRYPVSSMLAENNKLNRYSMPIFSNGMWIGNTFVNQQAISGHNGNQPAINEGALGKSRVLDEQSPYPLQPSINNFLLFHRPNIPAGYSYLPSQSENHIGSQMNMMQQPQIMNRYSVPFGAYFVPANPHSPKIVCSESTDVPNEDSILEIKNAEIKFDNIPIERKDKSSNKFSGDAWNFDTSAEENHDQIPGEDSEKPKTIVLPR